MKLYTSEYPSVPFDPAFKRFFEDFYAISDNVDAHSEYVDSFTKDATLIMASKKAQGSEGTVQAVYSRLCLIDALYASNARLTTHSSYRNTCAT